MPDVVCQYCGAFIQSDLVHCSVCDTPHHGECFRENGRCTTYACGSRSYVEHSTGHRIQLDTESTYAAPAKVPGKVDPKSTVKRRHRQAERFRSRQTRSTSWDLSLPDVQQIVNLIMMTGLVAGLAWAIFGSNSARDFPSPAGSGGDCMYYLAHAINDGNVDAVRKWAPVTILDYPWTRILPLHRAALLGRREMVKILVQAGAPLDRTGPCGTLLDCARASRDRGMEEFCRSLGAREVYNRGSRKKQAENRAWLCRRIGFPPPRQIGRLRLEMGR